jgi:hypothetical protein
MELVKSADHSVHGVGALSSATRLQIRANAAGHLTERVSGTAGATGPGRLPPKCGHADKADKGFHLIANFLPRLGSSCGVAPFHPAFSVFCMSALSACLQSSNWMTRE